MTELQNLIDNAQKVQAPSTELDRITIQLNAHYQQHGEDSTTSSVIYSDVAPTSETPPLQRWVSVGEEWSQLDTGWVDLVGYVLLESRVGKGLKVNPSSEQLQELLTQTIEVALSKPTKDSKVMLLGPRQPLLARFESPPWVRSRSKTVKMNITVFPRSS